MKTDREIHVDVLGALKFDPQIKEQHIAVAVKDGIVTLNGEVETHAQKMAAEQIVKRVAGVRGFAEELQVNPPGHHRRTDADIAEAAVNALRWNVLVPADRIQVKVENGWLTLFGDVTWNFERESAAKAVNSLVGLRGVSNKINVRPFVAPSRVKETILQAFERTARQEAQDVKVMVDGGVVTLEGTVHNWVEFGEAEWAAWSVSGVTEVRNHLIINVHKDKELSQARAHAA